MIDYKLAKPLGRKLDILGQRVIVRCEKCGVDRIGFFHGVCGYVECGCTLSKTGTDWRTKGKLE